jgi:hypothetical protein
VAAVEGAEVDEATVDDMNAVLEDSKVDDESSTIVEDANIEVDDGELAAIEDADVGVEEVDAVTDGAILKEVDTVVRDTVVAVVFPDIEVEAEGAVIEAEDNDSAVEAEGDDAGVELDMDEDAELEVATVDDVFIGGVLVGDESTPVPAGGLGATTLVSFSARSYTRIELISQYVSEKLPGFLATKSLQVECIEHLGSAAHCVCGMLLPQKFVLMIYGGITVSQSRLDGRRKRRFCSRWSACGRFCGCRNHHSSPTSPPRAGPTTLDLAYRPRCLPG